MLNTVFQKCGFSSQRPAKQYKSRQAVQVPLGGEGRRLRGGAGKKLVDCAQEAPDTVWLAGDEASLYLQASLRRVFAPIGQTPLVKAHPGRENTHFYGALGLTTGEESVLRSDLM